MNLVESDFQFAAIIFGIVALFLAVLWLVERYGPRIARWQHERQLRRILRGQRLPNPDAACRRRSRQREPWPREWRRG